MKNIILSALLCIGTLTAQAQEEFTIHGKVKGLKDGTMVELTRWEGASGYRLTSDTVKNESFVLKGEALDGKLEKITLSVYGASFPSMPLELWVEAKAHIHITGDNPYYYTWKVESPVEQQNVRDALVESSREFWNEYLRLDIETNALMNTVFEGKVTDKAERQKLMVQTDSLRKLQEKEQIKIAARNIELMKTLPVSDAWMDNLYLLAAFSDYIKDFPYKEETKALYGRLTDEHINTETGKSIRRMLFPPIVVKEGDDMADADLFDLQGNLHHLADYKGKYILLDFWSTGCGPCIQAIPEMKEISEQHKDKLTIVSLSIDGKNLWEKASARHQITWVNLNDMEGRNGLYAKYGVRGIPCYLLISPDGKVAKKWMGYGKGSLHKRLNESLPVSETGK